VYGLALQIVRVTQIDDVAVWLSLGRIQEFMGWEWVEGRQWVGWASGGTFILMSAMASIYLAFSNKILTGSRNGDLVM
jgi:hypothetical protein